jgi:cell division initiation protein
MFTPQEVRERSTTFEKAVFGGYSMNSVDDFIAPLAQDYATLYKENAVLKSKMKVLVERLEEYRKQEDQLNRAILAAQKTCDEMTAETERKCAKLMSDTEQTLRQRNQDLKMELAAEAERVARAKKAATAFITNVEDQVHLTLGQLEKVRELTITAKTAKTEHQEASAPAQTVQKPQPPEPPVSHEPPEDPIWDAADVQETEDPVWEASEDAAWEAPEADIQEAPEADVQEPKAVKAEKPAETRTRISPAEIAREIERGLSQALGSTGATTDLGDTMVIGSLNK